MKQKHTQAKKARRFNDWAAYQFKSGDAFAKWKRLFGFPGYAGLQNPVL